MRAILVERFCAGLKFIFYTMIKLTNLYTVYNCSTYSRCILFYDLSLPINSHFNLPTVFIT